MYAGSTPRFVSAAEITRNFGMWQDRAAHGPLIVTHHGRPRVAMVAMEHYQAIAGRGRPEGAEGLEAARLSVVLGQIGTAFAAFDAELRFIRVNAGAVAHLGLPEEQLLGRPADEVLTAREGMIARHLREVLRSGEEAQAEVAAGPAGERLLRLRLFPYPGGVAMTFRNVAGLRSAERAEMEQVAERAARTVHGGIGGGRLGLRGMFEAAEPALAAMTGFAPERLAGVRLVDLLALASREAAGAAVEAVLTGQGARAFDAALLTGTGERPARIALAELRDGFAITGAAVLVA